MMMKRIDPSYLTFIKIGLINQYDIQFIFQFIEIVEWNATV